MSIAFEATVSGVNRASAMLPDCLVAICCDGRGNWRKDLFPEYKAHRERQPQSMFGEMDRTIERLRKDGRLVWKCDGFEADDIIGTATKAALDRGHCVRIASSDKDLMQLLNVKVDFLATHVWEVVGPDKVREKFGVDPEQLGDYLALVGDKSDNVAGCPGIGDVKARKYLQDYGNLYGIWEALEKGPQPDKEWFTPANEKALRANVLNVEKARKLVSLRTDVPLDFDEIYAERKPQDIAGTDHMTEAEKDADNYFVRENQLVGISSIDAPKTEAPVVEPMGSAELPEPERNGSVLTEQVSDRDLKQPQFSPVPAVETAGLIRQRDKTPEEVEQVSRPTELVPYVEYSKQLEPRSLRDAQVYARMMFNSKVYSRYPTVESMTAAIVRGRELGFGAGASLDIFHVADFNRDGQLRLIMQAHLIIEQIERHPDVEYFMCVTAESDETKAVYESKKKQWPKPQRFTYTIDDAKQADLVKLTFNGKPNNWMKRPKELLRKTCGVQFGRIVAPGSAIGLYCAEEMGIDNE